MAEIYILTVAFICFLWGIYHYRISYELSKKIMNKGKNWVNLAFVLVLGLLVRSIVAVYIQGYEVDINCFTIWSDWVYDHGINNFYFLKDETGQALFTDYPPGYMLILYVVAAFRNLFGIETASSLGIYVIKFVPMICDLAAGYLVYQLASKRFTSRGAMLCCAAYVFNPAIIVNSAAWGQVDSVFTLAIVYMCYLFYQEKRVPAYFLFAAAILIKPQALILAPILIFVIIEQVFMRKPKLKAVMIELGLGLVAIASMIAVAFPFGLSRVIEQYGDTMGSYPYASLNAYNLWTLLGQNWISQDSQFMFMSIRQWGMVFIVGIVLLAAFIFFKMKDDKSKYFIVPAFISFAVFALSARMHERYMYPALILMLLAFLVKPKKEYFFLFGSLSTVHFLNVAHVFWYYEQLHNTGVRGRVVAGTSLLVLCTLVCMVYIMIKQLPKKDTMIEESVRHLTKRDWCILGAIVACYAVVAFSNLGSTSAPETPWSSKEDYTSITIDAGENKTISKVWSYLGNYENRKFTVEVTNDPESEWENIGQCLMPSVFKWDMLKDEKGAEIAMVGTYRYMRLTSLDMESVVMELAVLDSDGKLITPANANEYPTLYDEQDTFTGDTTYRNGTYFDEIYHARTAYEYTQGIYSYENTHPPLGKVLISVGIRMFGMNPFGWRVIGTLFGVLMLPLMYMFSKRMTKQSWVAGCVTTLFAFDFMHFAQTRIATIDVFVTFFIIAMYLAMYRYAQTDYRKTKWWKTWIFLALSGIAMGLGIASKWTGIYAGIGLAIIFFAIIIYRIVQNRVENNSKFWKYTWSTLGLCVVFFIIIPGLIYLLSYLPFRDGVSTNVFSAMFKNQKDMFSYHSTLVAEHPYSSMWYQWPVMIRPIFYYCGDAVNGLKEGISSFGNPLVWWAGIPATIYMIYMMFRSKDKTAMFLCVGYLAQYLPWFFVTRIIFIYHYFPSVPFITLMIGYAFCDIVKRFPKLKVYVFAYVALAVLLFIMFYPVLSGMPIDGTYAEKCLRWMSSWQLVY